MTISKPVGMVLNFNNYSSTTLSIKTFLSCFHANKSMAKAHAPPPPQPLIFKANAPQALNHNIFYPKKKKGKKSQRYRFQNVKEKRCLVGLLIMPQKPISAP